MMQFAEYWIVDVPNYKREKINFNRIVGTYCSWMPVGYYINIVYSVCWYDVNIMYNTTLMS